MVLRETKHCKSKSVRCSSIFEKKKKIHKMNIRRIFLHSNVELTTRIIDNLYQKTIKSKRQKYKKRATSTNFKVLLNQCKMSFYFLPQILIREQIIFRGSI